MWYVLIRNVRGLIIRDIIIQHNNTSVKKHLLSKTKNKNKKTKR